MFLNEIVSILYRSLILSNRKITWFCNILCLRCNFHVKSLLCNPALLCFLFSAFNRPTAFTGRRLRQKIPKNTLTSK